MKTTCLLAVAAFTLLSALTGVAAPFSFPSESKTWFTIDLPQAWHPKMEDGTLEATAPQDAAYVAVWLVKSEADFKHLDKDIDEILKDSVVEPKIGEPAAKTINGIEFMRFVGTGKDRKEKSPVTFEVWLFEVQPHKLAVVYFDYDTDATPEMIKSLAGMVDSIKKK
jgi:hypothetical protein